MKVEELFLRCWLCRGFSSNSGRHLLAYLQKHTVVDFQQLSHICQIVPRYQALFMEDFYQVPWQKYCQYHFITFNSPLYPQWLFEVYDAPPLLFYQGNIHLLAQPSVAIVGAR